MGNDRTVCMDCCLRLTSTARAVHQKRYVVVGKRWQREVLMHCFKGRQRTVNACGDYTYLPTHFGQSFLEEWHILVFDKDYFGIAMIQHVRQLHNASTNI